MDRSVFEHLFGKRCWLEFGWIHGVDVREKSLFYRQERLNEGGIDNSGRNADIANPTISNAPLDDAQPTGSKPDTPGKSTKVDLINNNKIKTVGGIFGGLVINSAAERLPCGPARGSLHALAAGLELFGTYEAVAWTVGGAVATVTLSETVAGAIVGGAATAVGATFAYNDARETGRQVLEVHRNFTDCEP